MNHITKVHLGQQAFTISVKAHDELKAYLDAISSQVKDKDVVNEIELRIAELLGERGISSTKVILPDDIDEIKKQLGSPSDFKEGDEDEEVVASSGKRLFRDTDNAIIAGVASGLGQYFGLDALLVRILFIVFVIVTAGWGILVYILLWLLIPEAKTSSERLQMAGKPVNVRSLKQVVKEADVKGAANRANNALSGPINSIFSFIVKVAGVILSAFGLVALFGLLGATTYYIVRNQAWSQNNIFPIGFSEHLLLGFAIGVAILLAVFVVIFGVALFRRKWPIKTWITGVLAGLIFVGLAVTGALIADVYPTVRNAYNDNTHQTTRSVPAFSSVSFDGNSIDNFNFAQSSKYMVVFSYYGHPNLSNIKTTVNKQMLDVDSTSFNWRRNCSTLCIPDTYQVNVTVYTPNANQLENSYQNYIPTPPNPNSVLVKPWGN